MTMTDEQLRERLAGRAAAPLAIPLDVVARSVAAQPRRRSPVRAGRWAVLGSMAGAATLGVALVAGLLGRPVSQQLASGSGSPAVGSPHAPSALLAPTTAPDASPIVTGCTELGFDARRCAAIVARAMMQGGDPPDVISVIVGPPPINGGVLLGGGAPIATVDLRYADGDHKAIEISCGMFAGPVSSDRVCSSDPQIRVADGVSRDTPCGPTPGDDTHPCGPLPPDPRPATIAASRPLIVPSLDIVLDHPGHYEVLVGTATIPDGAISERAATVADSRPTNFWIDPYIDLQVRPDRGGPPIDTYYARRVKGPEAVHVYLVFDVTDLQPGAVLQIRDIVVR